MSEFHIQVEIADGDVGLLRWQEDGLTLEVLSEAVSLAADDAILAHELRRVEARVLSTDAVARRALQRAGFRREGIVRQGRALDDGSFGDVMLYARLASDQVYGPGGFSGVMNSVLPTKRLISHVLFTDEQDRILLLETTYKTDLELPGGVVEPLESPRDGGAREVSEEIGLLVNLGSPALVDWMPPWLGWADALEFIYDGGVLDETARGILRLDPGEIRDAHWLGVDELDGRVSELSARRLRLIMEHRGSADGITLFTENGRLP